MNSNSFTIFVRPEERKIIISSEKESKYRIKIHSLVSGEEFWNSVHEVPSETSVWISPGRGTGYTDCFVGGCSVKVFSEKGDLLGEHFWKPAFVS